MFDILAVCMMAYGVFCYIWGYRIGKKVERANNKLSVRNE